MYGDYMKNGHSNGQSYINCVCEGGSANNHRHSHSYRYNRNVSIPVEVRKGISYPSTSSSQETTLKMGNKIHVHHRMGNSAVIGGIDSSSNNATSWQSPVNSVIEETAHSTRSLPRIKERTNTQLLSPKHPTSTLLSKGSAVNRRRNSVDSGYNSSGKVYDSSTSSDSSSGASFPKFAGNSRKSIVLNDKRSGQVGLGDGITDISKTTRNRASKIDHNSLLTRTRENSQLLTRRNENTRDIESVSDKFEQTTLENSRSRPHTGERSMISRSPNTFSRNGVVGLQNLGNTCFMNSILQCLCHCKPLRDKLLSGDNLQSNSKSKMKGKLFSAFSDLIKTMWSSKVQTSVSPFSFKLQIQRFSPRFVGYEQQDSQEFLRFLLDGLHEDLNEAKSARSSRTPADTSKLSEEETSKLMWKQYKSRDNSLVTELFCGQMISILTCTRCGHRSVTFDPFLDLSLPIPRTSYGSRYDSQLTIMDCLKLFTKLEDLDGNEKPKCEKCKTRQKCTKQFKFQRFPKILVLHLKRFSGFGYRSKLQTEIKFPLDDLDLSQFSSDCSGYRSVKYKLFAVSNHSGSTYDGHYTAYCRHPDSREWHSFNDSRVSDLSKFSVHGSQAYVLFYEIDEDAST